MTQTKTNNVIVKAGILLLFVFFSINSFAANTSGLQVVPDNFSGTNLTKLTWTSEINEYECNSSALTWLLRIEFNYVHFKGSTGTHDVGAMIQNNSQDFTNDVVGSRFSPYSNMTSNWGVGLYFTSLRSDWVDNKHGVELLANPTTFPKFGRIFEDVDQLGLIGKNVYSRVTSLGNPAVDGKITVKWTVTKQGTATNPVGNFSKDKNGNWVALQGTFAIWKFNVEINGVSYDVANYYLPNEYAEYINPTTPLSLYQEHFGGSYNALNLNKTHVRYYNMLAYDAASKVFPLDNWLLNWKIQDDPTVTDTRIGWTSDCNSMHSYCGHEEDKNKSQTVGNTFRTIQNVPVAKIVGLNDAYCTNEPTVVLQGNLQSTFFLLDNVPTSTFTPATLTLGNHTVKYIHSYYPTCDVSDTKTFTIKDAPVANAGSDVTINEGESTTLVGNGGNSLVWSTGASTSSIVVSPVATTTYTLTTTNATGCSAVDDVKVTVNQNTTIKIDSIVTTPDKCNSMGTIKVYAHGGAVVNTGVLSGTYTFTGTSNPDTNRRNATNTSTDVTYLPMTPVGLTSTPYADEFRLKGWNTSSTYNTNQYIEFGLQAKSDKSIKFKSTGIIQTSDVLNFKLKSNATEQFDKYRIDYSVDGAAWTTLDENNVPDVMCASIFKNPTTAPLTTGSCITQDSKAEITFDATGTKLAGLSQVYVYYGYNNWKGVPSSWTNVAQLLLCENLGNNKYKVTFSPSMREFFKTTTYVTELDLIFRNQAGTLQTPDYKLTITGGQDPNFESHSVVLPEVATEVGGNVKFRFMVQGESTSQPHVYVALDDVLISGHTYGSELRYSWYNTTQASNTFTNLQGGTYIISVTDIMGNYVSEHIQVAESPKPIANAGVDQAICLYDNTTLTAVNTNAQYTYDWSAGTSGVNVLIRPLSTHMYKLTVTDGFCKSVDSILVTVNPLPTATIEPVQPICKGNYAGLTATGGWGFDWSTGQWTAGQPISTIYVTPQATTTYTVTVSYNGCTNSESVVVTVNELPVIESINTTNDNCNAQGTIDVKVAGNGELVVPFSAVYEFTGTDASYQRANVTTQPNGATFQNLDIPGLASLAKTDKYRTSMWNATANYDNNEYVSLKATADADKKIRLTSADKLSFAMSTNSITPNDKLQISYRVDDGQWLSYATLNIVDGVCNSWTSNNASISLSQQCLNKDELFFVYFKAATYGGAVNNINPTDMYVYTGYNGWKGVPSSWNSTNELINAQSTSSINNLYTFSYIPTVNQYFKTTDPITSIQLIMRNKAGNVQTSDINIAIQNNGVASELVYTAPISQTIETSIGGTIEFRIQAININDDTRELNFDNITLTGNVVSTVSDYTFDIGGAPQHVGSFSNLPAGPYNVTVVSNRTSCSVSQPAIVANGCAPVNKSQAEVATTGLSELENGNIELAIYPNPARESIVLTMEGIATELSIVIYSVDGKVVYSNTAFLKEAKTIDISNLSAGVYMVSVKNDEQTFYKKLIVE